MKKASLAFLVFITFFSSCDSEEQIEKKKYISMGMQLYAAKCAQCHGDDGNGLGTLYPPIKDSDYIKNNQDSLACIIKYGLSGALIVNGIEYNQPMPANPDLYDEEIASIINYIQNGWGQEADFFSVEQARKGLDNCR